MTLPKVVPLSVKAPWESRLFVPSQAGFLRARKAVDAALDGDDRALIEVLFGGFAALVLAGRQPMLAPLAERVFALFEEGDPCAQGDPVPHEAPAPVGSPSPEAPVAPPDPESAA